MDAVPESLEYMQGNGDTACSLFESALELGKIKEDSRARAVLYIQYARFLDQVGCNLCMSDRSFG